MMPNPSPLRAASRGDGKGRGASALMEWRWLGGCLKNAAHGDHSAVGEAVTLEEFL